MSVRVREGIVLGSTLIYIGMDTDRLVHGKNYKVVYIPRVLNALYLDTEDCNDDDDGNLISVDINKENISSVPLSSMPITITDHFLTIQEYREQLINNLI